MLTETTAPKLGRGGRRRAGPRKDQPTGPSALVSERDWTLYRAIVSFKLDNDGNAPQLRELVGLAHMSSTSVVTHHLLRLTRAGLIEMAPGRAGRIRVRGGRWTPPPAVGTYLPQEGDEGNPSQPRA